MTVPAAIERSVCRWLMDEEIAVATLLETYYFKLGESPKSTANSIQGAFMVLGVDLWTNYLATLLDRRHYQGCPFPSCDRGHEGRVDTAWARSVRSAPRRKFTIKLPSDDESQGLSRQYTSQEQSS